MPVLTETGGIGRTKRATSDETLSSRLDQCEWDLLYHPFESREDTKIEEVLYSKCSNCMKVFSTCKNQDLILGKWSQSQISKV